MPRADAILFQAPANPLLRIAQGYHRGGLTESGVAWPRRFICSTKLARSSSSATCSRGAVERASMVAGCGAGRVMRSARLVPENFSGTATQGVVALVEPPRGESSNCWRRDTSDCRARRRAGPWQCWAQSLRAAEAFGATGVIFAKGTVNPFNPKALRASAGSLFRVPFVVRIEAAQVARQRSRPHGIADLRGACPCAMRSYLCRKPT